MSGLAPRRRGAIAPPFPYLRARYGSFLPLPAYFPGVTSRLGVNFRPLSLMGRHTKPVGGMATRFFVSMAYRYLLIIPPRRPTGMHFWCTTYASVGMAESLSSGRSVTSVTAYSGDPSGRSYPGD